jgi:hypothetical protein
MTEMLQITVAARLKAWTVFDRSNNEVMGSNPIADMDVSVSLFCVCVVLCVGSGLAKGWSPIRIVVLTLYRTTKSEKKVRDQQKGYRT